MSKSAVQKRTPLPSKEASLFKELLTLYETKQLKKGLKTADQILKKFHDHGETLCMKGLVLTHMGKREEGIDLVKKGIKLDLTSHICWHVFGLVQKGDRNYDEALKSYSQALRFDKENMNLLRDSAQLQTHLRLFENLVETRHTILRLRPNQRQNWIALAVAHHLNRNPQEARMVLEHYLRSLKNLPDHDIDHSETLLYYVHVLEEAGDLEAALASLDQDAESKSIVDRMSILETRARLLSKLKSPKAEQAWCALIQHNPDSYDALRGYLENEGLSVEVPSPEAIEKLEKFVQIPGSTAPRRLQLNLASGDQFRQLVEPYLIRGLEKGVPSLFADLKALYVDKEKQSVIETIVDSLREEYAPTTDTTSPRSKDLEPATYLWTLYFLAQQYSHLSHQSKALTLLDVAIEHTPTLPELHMLRGKILKRAGDRFGAVKSVNEARLLDGQDRFLNTKLGKYLLRVGMIDEAMPIFGLFTKKDAVSPMADLQEMQSLLFLLEAADAYRRIGKLNLALKKYMAVKTVFDEFENDQFDFHGYNLRKCTLNIYFQLLKWENQLRSHPAYVRAAIEASKIFVQVADDPSIVTALSSSSSQLTDAEKKAKKKAKKAEKKRVEEEKKALPQANVDKDLDNPPKKDDDPDGFKLLGCSDPLEQASRLLQPITSLPVTPIDVWIASYDVAIRRKKLLQAISALNHASSIDRDHPELHVRLVDVKLRSSALPQPPPIPIGPIFVESLNKLVPNSISLETFNSQYLQRRGSNATAVLAVARVLKMLESPVSEVENTIFGILEEGVEVDVQNATTAVEVLESLGRSGRVEEFKVRCQAEFPLSTVFKRPEEMVELKAKVLEQAYEKEDGKSETHG